MCQTSYTQKEITKNRASCILLCDHLISCHLFTNLLTSIPSWWINEKKKKSTTIKSQTWDIEYVSNRFIVFRWFRGFPSIHTSMWILFFERKKTKHRNSLFLPTVIYEPYSNQCHTHTAMCLLATRDIYEQLQCFFSPFFVFKIHLNIFFSRFFAPEQLVFEWCFFFAERSLMVSVSEIKQNSFSRNVWLWANKKLEQRFLDFRNKELEPSY